MTEPTSSNPWISIWGHPKQTMRNILNNFPTRFNHLFAIGGAFTHVVAYTASWYSWWLTFVIWVCLSIIAGLFALYVVGALLKWTGSWLKGQGSYQDIRSAIAWSQIPVLVFFVVEMIILWILRWDGSNIYYSTVLFILSLWSSIIFLCCYAEAHQFSFVKGLIAYVLGFVVLAAILVIVMMIISAFSPQSTPVATG